MVSTRSNRPKLTTTAKPLPHKATKKQTKTGKQNKTQIAKKPKSAKKLLQKNSQGKTKPTVKPARRQVISTAKVSKPITKVVKSSPKRLSTTAKVQSPPMTKTPAKASSKYPHYTPGQYETFKKYKEEIEDKKIPELKDMCRKNLMKVSGNKPELIERIADARILGVIPKCPSCGGGRPKLDTKTMTYYCSGYLEDVDFINCHKTFSYASISRIPWQS